MSFIPLYTRKFLVPVLLFISLIAVACSRSPHSPINIDADGVALKGYDPVAYFTMGRPVKGERQFGYEWSGATWLFASQEHKDLFMASPEKYAPQYGGY